jgi:5-methylcytosine-specific restriction endonuclease McrA
VDGLAPKQKWMNNTEWRQARKRAIASKEPYCAVCNEYIDIQLPMNDPDTGLRNPLAVEVDHITPRSRGGDLYELDNLQLTHMRCNRKKGAKMAGDYSEGEVTNPVPLSNNW